MSKKNLPVSINPLSALPKASKKGNKQSINDFIVDSSDISAEPSSEEAPRLKKLKKVGQKDREKEKLVEEKVARRYQEEEEEEESQVAKSESEEIEYERFKNVDDEELAKMEDESKNKKGKSKKKAKKGEQELDKFVQKHPVKEKQKKPAEKPTTQMSLMSMFKSSSQPRKPEPSSTRMQEEKPKSDNSSDSDSEDEMQIFRKRQAMMKMSENLNAGLSEAEALKQAMKESLKETQHNQPVHVPLQNYSYQAQKTKSIPTYNQAKKEAVKHEQVQKKQEEKKKNEPKNEARKREKSVGKKQKPEHTQKAGPLAGLAIVTTGEFGDYSKGKMLQLLQKLGADLPKGITKKTTHLLQGSHILNTYGKKTDQDPKTTTKSTEAAQKNITIIPYEELDNFFIEKTGKSVYEHMEKDRPQKQINMLERFIEINKEKYGEADKEKNYTGKKTTSHDQIEEQKPIVHKAGISVPWTQKYRPRSSQQIIGQNSQIKNLKQWLDVWQDIHIRGNKRDVKPNFNAFMPSGTINSNAALLSGDAGLGKTTAARLIANQYGYSVVEYNASDARNKKSVEMISAGKNNMSFINDKNKDMQKTLIIMDEVDGMSSGDRGGISAIIEMIKKTKVPIICICNDRQSTKIRSLAGHCYDIKFHKPDKRMIARRLQNIIDAEGGSSSVVALQKIVQLLQNDIRQILTYLQVIFKGGTQNINMDVVQRRCGNTKDNSLTINHFQAAKMLLSRTISKQMSINQKTQLTFVDSDMVPLMIQQNYLGACGGKNLKFNSKSFLKVVKASQAFVGADLLDRSIMRNQNYCLMPNKMFLSCIYPCEMACENMGFPKFTQWLGKYSSERKNKRLIKQLKYSLSSVATVTSSSVKNHYVPMLYERIYQSLKNSDQNIQKIVQFMLHYGITPATLAEHLTCLQYGQRENLLKNIETSKKTKLTKAYNKACQATKFKKQKTKAVAVEHVKYDPVLGEMENQNQEEEEQEQNGEESMSDIVMAKKTNKPKQKKK